MKASLARETWQLQEAKARMSEMIERAQKSPQEITVHGRPVAVVVSRATFDSLSQAQGSLVEFMRQSPLRDADDVTFDRDKSRARKVHL